MSHRDKLGDLGECVYCPTPSESLYHYCTVETFWAILESRTLWFTSIEAFNDPTELRWGRKTVTRLLQANRATFPDELRLAVHAVFAGADGNLLPTVFCLSRTGDLLSQWRAYAADGTGVAIEFRGERVTNELPVNMKAVVYDRREQLRLIRNSLRTFSDWWGRGEREAVAVVNVIRSFSIDLLALKHPSFFEEREVRMIHLLVHDGGDYRDPGGWTEAHGPVPPVQVRRRECQGRSMPFVALPFDPASQISAVVLGPKNRTSAAEVRRKLGCAGLDGVQVRRSRSPYR